MEIAQGIAYVLALVAVVLGVWALCFGIKLWNADPHLDSELRRQHKEAQEIVAGGGWVTRDTHPLVRTGIKKGKAKDGTDILLQTILPPDKSLTSQILGHR